MVYELKIWGSEALPFNASDTVDMACGLFQRIKTLCSKCKLCMSAV